MRTPGSSRFAMHDQLQALRRARRAALMAGTVAAGGLTAVSAQAQDTDPNDAVSDVIIVTATKREQTLQEVPVAVTVTSAATIERAQIRDLKDLQSMVPSLRVNQLQSSANTNFYIRGFGNGANNAGIEPSVGLFIDGVYRSRSASMIADFPDVERIEVLHGPQSTLFGKNASAGVISIVTKKPAFDFGGNFEASYGNYDAIVLKGRVTGPISETIAASIAGGMNKRDGIVKNPFTGDRTNERDRWFTRGQLLFDNHENFSFRLIGDYGKIDENCCAVVNLRPAGPTQAILALGGLVNTPAQAFDNIAYSNFESTNKIENWGVSGQADYDLGAVKLTSITAYRKTDAVTNQDSDFSSLDLLGRNYQDLRIKTFTQELRATFDLSDKLSGLVGAYYFNERIKQANQVQWGTQARPYANFLVQQLTGCFQGAPSCNTLPGVEAQLSQLTGQNFAGQFFANGQGLDEHYRLKNDAYSLFAQVDFEIAPRLTITGGINYTHDKKTFATNTTSNDVFAGLDLTALGQRAIFVQGLVNAGVNPADLAAVQAFATNPLTAPFYQGIVNFAAANASNPAVNPLLAFKPYQYFPPFQNVPNAVESGRISDGDFSYTARVSYDMTDKVNLYASFATGYKAASVNLSRDSKPNTADLAALRAQGLAVTNLVAGSRYADPEDATVYEAGLKANWGLVTANLAVFKQTIKNFQSNIFTGSGFFLANAGKQSAFGIEFSGTARPIPQLTLGMAVTYLDPKYDTFKLSAFGDLSGSTPAGVSPLAATWSADFVQPVGGDRFIAHLDYHYEAPFRLVEGLPGLLASGGVAGALAAAKEFQQEINDLNGSLTYELQNGFAVSVWGRNLLNDRTILQIFDSPAQPGSISGYPNQPRTYGVSARYSF